MVGRVTGPAGGSQAAVVSHPTVGVSDERGSTARFRQLQARLMFCGREVPQQEKGVKMRIARIFRLGQNGYARGGDWGGWGGCSGWGGWGGWGGCGHGWEQRWGDWGHGWGGWGHGPIISLHLDL